MLCEVRVFGSKVVAESCHISRVFHDMVEDIVCSRRRHRLPEGANMPGS